MQGLLDFIKTPEGQGLLSAVAGGMSGARRGTPWNNFGRAGVAGVMGYGSALDRQAEEARQAEATAFRGLQSKKMLEEMNQAAQTKKERETFELTLPEADRQLFRMNPTGYFEAHPKFQKPKQPDIPWYVQVGPDGKKSIDPAYAEFEKSKAAHSRPTSPYFTPIPTVNGLGKFDNRTGTFQLIDGGGITKPADSPQVQGQITDAKETAKAGVEQKTEANKAIKRSNQFIEAANKAEELLKRNPTQSYGGMAADQAARMFGVSTQGAQVAGELEAIGGWLTANVPRMEGPQSNFDVAAYQTMAGKVGDRTVPIKERQAALKTVKALQEKYKALNQAGPQDGGYSDEGKERRYQEWKAKQK